MDWSAFLSETQSVVTTVVGAISSGLALLIGLYFIASGLNKMVAYSKGFRQGQPTVGPVALNLGIGAMLMQFARTVNMLIHSVFGSDPSSPSDAMAYVPAQVANSEMLRDLVQAGILWMFAIGVVAVLRGLILWNEISSGSGRTSDNGWKGLWHIVFGALAINMTGILKMFHGS